MNDPRNAGDRSPKTLKSTVARESLNEQPATPIGPYKLLEQIGAGVFGFVFVAAQQQTVRCKAAPKLIRPRLHTHEVIAQFEAERQALSLLRDQAGKAHRDSLDLKREPSSPCCRSGTTSRS
jgi:serine/threonine protein kinase